MQTGIEGVLSITVECERFRSSIDESEDTFSRIVVKILMIKTFMWSIRRKKHRQSTQQIHASYKSLLEMFFHSQACFAVSRERDQHIKQHIGLVFQRDIPPPIAVVLTDYSVFHRDTTILRSSSSMRTVKKSLTWKAFHGDLWPAFCATKEVRIPIARVASPVLNLPQNENKRWT